jgi:hypothetical protein
MMVSKRTDAQQTLSSDDLARLEEPIMLTAEDMVEPVAKSEEPAGPSVQEQIERAVAEAVAKTRAELAAAPRVRKVVEKEQIIHRDGKPPVRVVTRETVEE